jgi:hypothetical protein
MGGQPPTRPPRDIWTTRKGGLGPMGAARDADRTYDTGTNPWRSGRPSICTFIQPSCSWPSAEKWGAGS